MHRLKKAFVTVCAFTGFSCSAQTFTTPEVYSFKQEVFRPISYYTGQANITIPLTQVKTNEITIPITLNYVGGSGLRAVNPYSSVGMGWRISAGGAITRSKNGVCDEFTIGVNGANLNGFFSLTPNSVSSSYVRNNVSSYVTTTGTAQQSFIPTTEYSPDVFSFSFLGYSGYFLMGYDGQFKIQSQDIVSVDKISNVSWPGQGNAVAFTLTANDGTKFTFGNSKGSMELSGGHAAGAPYQCEAWYLTKVESPNGRIITLSYQDNESTFVRFDASTETPTSSVCPVVLDNITFNGSKVAFASNRITQNITNAPSYPSIVNKIELSDPGNKVINTASFTYSTESSQRYYLLDQVTVDDKTYSFGYYNRTALPAVGYSMGADYWGFYNGLGEVTSVGTGNVSSFWDMYLNPTVTYAPRAPSTEFAKRGILTSITYPTGGTEDYEYEANTYSYLGKQINTGTSYSFSEEPKIGGGLRISKITVGNMVKKYRYVNTFDPTKPDYDPQTMSYIGFSSSGILYRLPGVPYYGRSVPNALCIDGEPPVVYSKVIEFLSDKSYTEYTLRSPIDKPDGDNNQNTAYFSVGASNTNIFNNYPKKGFVGSLGKMSSHALERGQVSSIKVYDGANTLKKSVVYTYATDPNRYSQNVPVVYMATTADPALAQLGGELGLYYNTGIIYFSAIHSYEIYTFPVFLEQKVETSYDNGSSIQRTTQYQYNAQKLRSTVITTNSTGETIKTVVKYPADINSGAYASMVTKKMLNYPTEQVQFNNTTITGSTLTTYKANGSSYVPDKKYSLEITSPFAEAGFVYFNGTTKDSRYGAIAENSYDSYDTYGNLTQATAKSGIVTSYLWDASGLYPMAKVEGGTYSQINAQNGKPANYSSASLYSSLNGLVPTAIINTYAYKPLIGLATATDSRGRLTTYVYDQFNRLTLIRDHDNNILKQFCYNYQGQMENCGFSGNQLLSQTFKKNNCTGCLIGSSVAYPVQPNTYYANTQTDANAMAQNEINANGQAYANANGTCNSPVQTTLISSNLVQNKRFTVNFRNNCTNTEYSYVLNANTSNITLTPQLPTGNYDVTFTPEAPAGTANHLYWVNGFTLSANSGPIYGVDIISGSNQVRVYN